MLQRAPHRSVGTGCARQRAAWDPRAAAAGANRQKSRLQSFYHTLRSTAELVALAQCAIEMIYIISLLKFIGYVCKGDVMSARHNRILFPSSPTLAHIERK